MCHHKRDNLTLCTNVVFINKIPRPTIKYGRLFDIVGVFSLLVVAVHQFRKRVKVRL